MVGGCRRLDNGTKILDLAVDCPQPNVNFSRQVTQPFMVSSYIGNAVSVQHSSGTILGCGRLERHFPVYARYRDRIVFEQKSQYHRTDRVDYFWHIFQYSILESIVDTCRSDSAIFDPWKPPPEQVGNWNTSDQFPVGDLYNRWWYNYYIDVPLIGSATILGHAVCTDHDSLQTLLMNNFAYLHMSHSYMHTLHIIQINDSRCNSSLELVVPEYCGGIQLYPAWYGTGNTVRGYAEFTESTLKGNITFVSILLYTFIMILFLMHPLVLHL